MITILKREHSHIQEAKAEESKDSIKDILSKELKSLEYYLYSQSNHYTTAVALSTTNMYINNILKKYE